MRQNFRSGIYQDKHARAHTENLIPDTDREHLGGAQYMRVCMLTITEQRHAVDGVLPYMGLAAILVM